MTESKSKRRWLQFGLGALLLAIVYFAAMFAGFRMGYDRGVDTRRLGQPSTVVYNVGDITDANGKPDVLDLIDTMENTIEPESWDARGGNATVKVSGTDQLVVLQTNGIQEEIRVLLQSIRDGRTKIKSTPHPDPKPLGGGEF